MTTKELKDSFKSLPIEIGHVLLWLVYRDVKPMASIVLTFNWNDNKNDLGKQKMQDWLKKANVLYKVSQKFGETLHISKDQKNLDENSKFELLDTPEAHFVRGTLYGFPKEAAQIFPSDRLIHPAFAQEIINEYWYPYVEYFVRKDSQKVDSEVAKIWADVARQEIPNLASKYEKNRINDLHKFREMKK